jgi:hypothetical protein
MILDEGKRTMIEIKDGDVALFQTYDDNSGVIFEMGFANAADKGDENGRRVSIDLSRLSTIDALLELLIEARARMVEYNNLNTTPL